MYWDGDIGGLKILNLIGRYSGKYIFKSFLLVTNKAKRSEKQLSLDVITWFLIASKRGNWFQKANMKKLNWSFISCLLLKAVKTTKVEIVYT